VAVSPWGTPQPPGPQPGSGDDAMTAAVHQVLPPPAPETALADTVEAAIAVAAVATAIGRYLVEAGVERSRATGRRLLVRPGSTAAHLMAAVADRVVRGAAREVLARLDVPALVRQYIDVDEIVEQVDIARVIDRVDLDAVVAKVDLDRAVDGVDVDRVIDRTDIVGLARYVIQEIDLPALLRYSTGSVGTEMVRGVRGQGVDADRAVERVVDRLLLRRSGRRARLPLQSDPSQEGEAEP
jgi:hypothetical protein